MTTTTLPSTTCPQDGRPATRFAFDTSANYLSCANGHVFPVEVTEPPAFAVPVCGHSTLSITDCQPLCDRPATQHAQFRSGCYTLDVYRCDEHVAVALKDYSDESPNFTHI